MFASTVENRRRSWYTLENHIKRKTAGTFRSLRVPASITQAKTIKVLDLGRIIKKEIAYGKDKNAGAGKRNH